MEKYKVRVRGLEKMRREESSREENERRRRLKPGREMKGEG